MKPQGVKNGTSADSGRLGRELLGLFAIFCALLLFLSLATFDSRDPWLNHVVSGVSKVHNRAGLFGAYLSGLLYDILGYGAWLLPLFFCLVGGRRILGAVPWPWWRWTGFILLGVCLCLAGTAGDLGHVEVLARGVVQQGAGNTSSHGGGIIGHMLYVGMVGWMNMTGAILVWLFCLALGIQMLSGVSWLVLVRTAGTFLYGAVAGTARGTYEHIKNSRSEQRLEQLALEARSQPSQQSPLPVEVVSKPVEQGKAAALAPASPPSGPAESSGAIEEPEEREADALPDHIFKMPVQHPPTGTDAGDEAATARENGADTVAQDYAAPLTAAIDEPDPASLAGTAPLASDALVHPLVPRPWKEAQGDFSDGNSAFLLPELPMPDGSANAAPGAGDEDMPPWVLDFEQGRLGVQPQSGKTEPVPPGEDQDSDLLDILWGAEQNAASPGNGRAEPEISLGLSAGTPPPPDATKDAPQQYTEQAPTPALSDKTAAAVHVLRAAAAGDSAALAISSLPERPVDMEAAQAPALEPEAAGVVAVVAAPSAVIQAEQPGALVTAVRRLAGPRLALPSLDLLEAAPPAKGTTPRGVLEEKGKSLMTCLKDFGIQGELVGITPGPVVTMFEVRPAPGVRVSRIANLSDDLALALKAVAVRIQAPVPGTDTVGVEIPNEVRETVCLRELLGSQLFRDSKSMLTLALGKDIAGVPAIADLATMPHLLVAGATGAGKSVGINSIILSILYKARPSEVKLLLIDPKRVEMAIYADLPHLVHPVVTEMPLAKNALEWAVSEMEERYDAIARAGVRNIADYNAKIGSFKGTPPSGMEDLEPLPYLVIVIDELADLMLVAAKEVETSIVRLAQLARAAGIHLILATQRPSVDVVTGLIKANFPCRISFQVTSKHDSRTILDTVGAEHLLGKGDMLFKPGGGKFQRMHGAFVSDRNVHAVVDYWKSRQKPSYYIDFADWGADGANGSAPGGGIGGGDTASDPLYNEAVEFVRQQGKASISLIQRKFRIGYNKAARFVEQMEQDGIIGPADGSRPRQVFR